MSSLIGWRGRKVAVTGAGGFIGSHLVEQLVLEGARVKALVHYNGRGEWGYLEELPPSILAEIEVCPGDVTDAFTMRTFVADQNVVFHLAALIGIPFSYSAPQLYVNTNIQGTLNILEGCRSEKVGRLVHVSTSEVYGTAQYAPIDEKHPLQGQSPYSASKIAADKLVESYHRSFGVPAVTVRPFNTYGPRQSARAIIPAIIIQALKNKCVRLGSLEPIRDLSFVKDTVAGFLSVAAGLGLEGRTLNVCSGSGLSIGQLATMILRVMDVRVEIIHDQSRVRPESSEVMKLEGDSNLIRVLTGWQPKYSLNEGLQETISYVVKNLDRYKAAGYAV